MYHEGIILYPGKIAILPEHIYQITLRTGKVIYLDNNSTTRMDNRVLDAMTPYLTEYYANPASPHSFATVAENAVKEARIQVSNLIGAEPKEIIFTSGATEAINLAIKGVAESYRNEKRHIVTVASEHNAVLDTCKYLETIGFDITYLPVCTDGLIDLEIAKKNIRNDTLLVSVMYVNNETGVIQPIQEIAEIAHSRGAFFMSDATQAIGKMSIDVNKLGIDLMSFSAHKFYGPKGIGGLFVRRNPPHWVKLNPLIHGGGHEARLRSGTLNVPAIVGLGKAAEIALNEMNPDAQRIEHLRTNLESGLLQIKDTTINGNISKRLYNVSNISFKGIYAGPIVGRIKDIALSTGSACTSASLEPSHVLSAMGLSEAEAYSSIRFSLGRFNTQEEITEVIEEFRNIIEQLRLGKAIIHG